jgi:hypothetical protein
MFEDGTDEKNLKLVKDFKNMTKTSELWEQDNGAKTIYCSFHRCLSGATRDHWDQIHIINEEEETKDQPTFQNNLWELTKEIVGLDACRNQKEFLKKQQNLRNICEIVDQ